MVQDRKSLPSINDKFRSHFSRLRPNKATDDKIRKYQLVYRGRINLAFPSSNEMQCLRSPSLICASLQPSQNWKLANTPPLRLQATKGNEHTCCNLQDNDEATPHSPSSAAGSGLIIGTTHSGQVGSDVAVAILMPGCKPDKSLPGQ